ncbi:hypothetical protein [Microbacterium sp. gxy059]|uniref:hypothetical protein n=1 Tax=Microbacterium sp. gxy059 TaxID=2957199 RepID=UPI003D98EFB1
MAHAYQNATSGQVVVSDEPRSDLEALARWKGVPVPADPADPVGSPENDPTGGETGSGSNPSSAEAAGDGTHPGGSEGDLEPSEEWTHEQLDAYAAERDVKFPANTNKAVKVAALTAPTGD